MEDKELFEWFLELINSGDYDGCCELKKMIGDERFAEINRMTDRNSMLLKDHAEQVFADFQKKHEESVKISNMFSKGSITTVSAEPSAKHLGRLAFTTRLFA